MKLKEIREAKGITQQELAENIGVAPRTIGRYESGDRKPDEEKLFQIAETLGVTVTELLSGEQVSGEESISAGRKTEIRQSRWVGNIEQRKMCPFRTFTRREPDGYTAQRFSECLYGKCMMFKNGECTMKS